MTPQNDLIGGTPLPAGGPPDNETKNYGDGSSATGPGALPDVSPAGAPVVDPAAVPVVTEPKGETAESIDAKIEEDLRQEAADTKDFIAAHPNVPVVEVPKPEAVQVPPDAEEEPDTVIAATPDYKESYETAMLELAQERAAHDATKQDLAVALSKLKNAAEMGFTGANIHRGA